MSVLDAFASDVGPAAAGPVSCVGGRTHWDVGGSLRGPAREVSAPAGVVVHEPGEMIVRVRAGTTLAELDAATRIGGQFVAVEADQPDTATIGGVLACGRSGLRRLGRGPIRDAVLEMSLVTADGRLVRAGAPLVKNVTGFDLCRLMVGSVGTLAFVGEVVLRCQPVPDAEIWWRSEPGAVSDPFAVFGSLYRPLAVLWDGTSVWVGLAGHPADIREQVGTVLEPAGSWAAVEGPPPVPGPARRSVPSRELPAAVAALSTGSPGGSEGRWLAEIGTGLVHCGEAAGALLTQRPAEPAVVELHRRIKERFDPHGRLNPGRSPLGVVAVAS